MSDSLLLTGVKTITQHTGTEMLRTNPKAGDTFQLKQWWAKNTVNTVYVDCTVFNVTQAAGTVKLAIASNGSTNLNIAVGDDYQFLFFNFNEVSRAALYTSDMQLIEHYAFPSVSGGKVMTIIPQGAAVRPVPDTPVVFDGDGSITGTVEVDQTITVNAAPYSGGNGTVTMSNILQSSTTGSGNWLFVSSSPNASFTQLIPDTLEGLYLRQSTQVTDDDGLVSRNSAAVGPVAPEPAP